MAIKLSEHFTYKKLLKFTYPTAVMTIFTTLYGTIDGIFVSNFAGSEAFAAIGIMWPFVVIFGSIGFMVGSGGSALVSKTLGEEKKEKARRYFSLLIYFDIVMGLIISSLSELLLPFIVQIFVKEGDTKANCIRYGRILFASLPIYILQNSFQSFLIAAERPKLGLAISVGAGLTNIFLDFIFIYLCRWGITGAAIATALSQVVGGVIPLVFFLCKNGTPYRLGRTGLVVKPIAQACLNGLSEMVMNISESLVISLYNYQLLKIVGVNGVIAYGIILYEAYIFIGAFIGFSNGVAPIVSFHLGAKNVEEIQNLFRKGVTIIFVTSLLLTGVGEAATPLLAKIFVGYDETLYQMTLKAIRIYFLSFLLLGYNTFSSAFFTGLNNGVISAIISITRTLILQTIMIFVLPLIFGVTGVWMAVIFSEGLSLILSITLLLLNRKKYQYF